ncbi:DUF397 domain-containing protein [Nocardia sp. NPDC003693]
MRQTPRGAWFKSSKSDGADQCVEICHEDTRTGVRDSKHVGGPELWFTADQWNSFLHSSIWQR